MSGCRQLSWATIQSVIKGAIYIVLGTAALSTADAKHSVRAASSVGSEKDKLRTRTTGFVKRKIGLAKDCSLIWFQQGKTFGRKSWLLKCILRVLMISLIPSSSAKQAEQAKLSAHKNPEEVALPRFLREGMLLTQSNYVYTIPGHGFQVTFPEVSWFPLREGEVGMGGDMG
ncbi:hypothetical protein TURU_105570 [Turdus rufiventris]|nr:hypothetical protein TURU_105570 [Turdus rufiventris]